MVVSRGLAMVVVGEAVVEDIAALEEMKNERKTWLRLANLVVSACWALVLTSVDMVGTEARDDVVGREVVDEGREAVVVEAPRELLQRYVIVSDSRHRIVLITDTLSFAVTLLNHLIRGCPVDVFFLLFGLLRSSANSQA